MRESGQRTALVTGASGTIGRRLCARLQESGWRVIGLSTRDPAAGPWHRYLAADLAGATPEALGAQLKGEGITAIWHLAGKAHALAELRQEPAEYDRINTDGTRTVLALARLVGARRFILASSVKAMGEGTAAVLDETATCSPLTPYGRSKLAAEQLVRSEGADLEPVVLRFCMVYGGNDRGNMARMLEAVRRGRFPPFPETGNQRSFVHVDDVVEACLRAGTEAAAVGEVFLVTDGRFYSTRELYLAMRAALQLPPPRLTPPLWLFRLAARAGDLFGAVTGRRAPLDSDTLAKLTDSAVYSSAKIKRLLGYAPAWPLARGLAVAAAKMDDDGGAA